MSDIQQSTPPVRYIRGVIRRWSGCAVRKLGVIICYIFKFVGETLDVMDRNIWYILCQFRIGYASFRTLLHVLQLKLPTFSYRSILSLSLNLYNVGEYSNRSINDTGASIPSRTYWTNIPCCWPFPLPYFHSLLASLPAPFPSLQLINVCYLSL